MSRKCKISNKKGLVGNRVSHSKRRTKHKQEVNLQTKTYWSEEKQTKVTVRISTSIMKTIARDGLDTVLRKNNLTLADVA